MQSGRFDMLQSIARLWPFERALREGPAHIVMMNHVPPDMALPIIEKALKANPYSSDLLLARMQYAIEANNQTVANESFIRARDLLSTKTLARAILGRVELQ